MTTSTSYEAPAVRTNVSAATAQAAGIAAPASRRIGPAFEWFLQLPVQVVLLVMWGAGIVFFGACALWAYASISALMAMVAGGF